LDRPRGAGIRGLTGRDKKQSCAILIYKDNSGAMEVEVAAQITFFSVLRGVRFLHSESAAQKKKKSCAPD